MSILENQKLVKSIIVGVAGFSIDKLYFKSTSLKNSMILASSMASASYVASLLAPKLPDMTQRLGGDTSMYDITTLQERVLEVGLSTGSAYVLNSMILKNMKPISLIEIGILFLGSSIIGELTTDYLTGKPISYLM